MRKSKQKLDLSIRREITASLSGKLIALFGSPASGSVQDFAFKYQQKNYLLKYVDENTDPADVRRHRAIVKWLGVERLNARTNERLYSTDPFFKGLGYGHSILIKASRLVERVLGKCPPEDLLSRGSFSGGASTSLKRGVDTHARKFSGNLDATPEAFARMRKHLEGFETWTLHSPGVLSPRLVKGNVLFTVPKTALIDRVACKEPDVNIFAQKAVGDFIRSRLKRKAKIDLNDQSINRDLARQASIDGSLATIDLSSASDSLSVGLVSLLLPNEWFKLLDDLRCHKTFIDGASHTNAMFSSMGNGFTFELESLIFWALAHAVRGATRSYGRVSVYGDDILLPASCAGVFVQFLHWVGFRTNVDKTFISGPFRESCGGHYYRGHDVTPFFLRRPFRDVSDLILHLNQFRAWIIRTCADVPNVELYEDNAFISVWSEFAALVPTSLRGGYEVTSRVQLVSLDRPKCELVPTVIKQTRLEEELQTELYLSRIASHTESQPQNWEGHSSCPALFVSGSGLRPAPDPAASSSLTTVKGWEVRRIRVKPEVFGLTRPLFLQEEFLCQWEPGLPGARKLAKV